MSLVPAQSNRFKHGEHWLAYEIYGESGTPFLLLHGILLDSHVNRELAQRFASEGFKVILLDLLGHGNSDKPTDPTEYRNEFFAEQVVACLDHLGIRQAIVGGVSLGAIVTLQAAAIAPQRIKAMFLEMPVMEWSTPFAAVLLTPVLTVVRWAKLVYRPFTHFLKKLPRPNKGWAVSVLNAASADPDVTSAILHGILVGPVVPTAKQRRAMTMPTLVIGHRGDKLHAHEDAHVLAGQLPNAQLLNATSILELRSKPERLMPEILEFLRSVSAETNLKSAAG
ncbi:MAG: alpha/beta hydrolase [Pseudomonadota bacterium]